MGSLRKILTYWSDLCNTQGMGYFKEIQLDPDAFDWDIRPEDLSGMEKQELLWCLTRLSEDIQTYYVDRARYYGEEPSIETLEDIQGQIKEIIKRYS